MLKLDNDGRGTDPDLLSGCTIAVDRYRDAISKACSSAKVLGADSKTDIAVLKVDAKDLTAGAFKVVTERNVVYLMGRVTQREAQRASDIARGVNGVSKVVRVFEYLTEDELVRLGTPRPAPVTTGKAPSSRNEP